MPKLTFDTQSERLSGTGRESFLQITPTGFIDSSSCGAFERALDAAVRRGTRFAVLDLSRVHYINSTGISLIIRTYGVYKERGGLFVLAAVPRSIGLSMHLLGVTSLVPFHKDIDSAREQFRRVVEGSFEYPETSRELGEDLDAAAAGKKKIYVPLRRRRSPLKDSRVLLLIPKPSRFSRVLKLRFRHLNGNFHVAHDPAKALESIDAINPDLVVVDHRLDRAGDFIARLKLHPKRSLISVIKIYSRETRIEEELDFKVWENDYLVDPFELLELFTLSEAELIRVPKDRKVFQQQVRFEFRTTRENVDKAARLAEVIIRSALAGEEDRTAMLAALKEGIDNAVVHGNAREAERTVDVNFLVDRSKLTILIEDEGSGFDFEYYLSRLDDQETFERARKRILEGQRGGLGILLMHRCTDRIAYAGSGNILRLEKNRD